MKENCMILVDTSECMRNGDYIPSRMESQQDAVNLIVQGKISSNPETTVGIITMSYKNPTVQIALSNNLSKLLSTTSSFRIEGPYVKFSKSLKTGKLALKHRSTEGSARRRMIVFVGSPIYETNEELEQLAETLKKSNIYVDVIHFGCTETEEKDFFIQKPFLSDLNTTSNYTIVEEIEKESKQFSTREKLETFINRLNEQQSTTEQSKEKNNHFLYVAPNTDLISSKIVSSGIMEEAAGGAASMGVGAMPGSEDEQIQMAMRLSMMEADRARMQQMQPPTAGAAPGVQQIAPQPIGDEEDLDEAAMIERAIQMSLMEEQEKEAKRRREEEKQKPQTQPASSSQTQKPQTQADKVEPLGDVEMPGMDDDEASEHIGDAGQGDEEEDEDYDEEAEMARALMLSKMEAKQEQKGKEKMEIDEDEEQLRLAMELSKQSEKDKKKDDSKDKDEDMEDALDDEAYLEQIAKSIKKKDEENKKK